VSIAVTGLLDHVEQLNADLQKGKTQLENLQGLIDVDTSPALPNRRAFIKRLEWSIAMNKRYNGSASVVVFRFNDHDEVNRVYGYQASTRAASYIAEYLAANIRDTDFFARIGENQFGVIMFFAEFDDVKAKAERMRNQLRNNPMRWNNGLINFSMAFGVHAITAADTPESALMAATNAVYTDNQRLKFEEINIKA
jgi:diguanylate cyclase (GGDEF)-like protein